MHYESPTGRESDPLARYERFQFITSPSPGLVLAQQHSLPAGGLRLCRAGVEPAGSRCKVSAHRHPPCQGLPWRNIIPLLFIFGMKVLLQDGLDYRKGLVVGVAFWIGIAFQLDWIFPEYFRGQWSELLGNGMTVGGFTVILMSMFRELTGGRRQRLRTELDEGATAKIDAFLASFASRRGWDEAMVQRIRAVGEETLQVLLPPQIDRTDQRARRLLMIARGDGAAADLEFIAATDETNLEDQMAMLGEGPPSVPIAEETSLRLLRHYASSVRHQQYHDTDVVTVRVEPRQSM